MAREGVNPRAEGCATGVVIVAANLADTAGRKEPDAIVLEVGRFDAIKNVQPANAFGGEYRLEHGASGSVSPISTFPTAKLWVRARTRGWR
jgi:hypothetical protein